MATAFLPLMPPLIPVLFLKNESSPVDGYEELFSQHRSDLCFQTYFVPVLDHIFQQKGMEVLECLLREKKFNGSREDGSYGGLIFTSQRAVEAFAELVAVGASELSGGNDDTWPNLQDVPIYSVGPATTRALKAVQPRLQVFGERTGNGDKLAAFIHAHYGKWYGTPRPPLLFVVGDKRRDIIPKALSDPDLPPEERIRVDETTVYGTAVRESFLDDFKRALSATEGHGSARWVVVFSPTGSDRMLEGLGMLNVWTKKAKPKESGRTTFIATIGPTTRGHLQKTFGFEPDVCAEEPSPEGVLKGIARYMHEHNLRM